MRQIWLAIVILIMVTSAQAAPSWQKGDAHNHSPFSDGLPTPKQQMTQALDEGCSFLIITDHYEQIGSPQSIVTKLNKEWGFEKYRQAFQSNNGLIVIPGAEIQTFWESRVLGKSVASHTLALGDIYETSEISDYQNKMGTQQTIINSLNKLGYLTVAAHPHCRKVPQNRVWEPYSYPYDKDHAEGIKGIEFFNESPVEYKETRAWYLSLLAVQKDVFGIGGQDTHVAIPGGDGKFTYVYSEKTKRAILAAMREGHTYACQNGCWFKSLNLIPGFRYQPVDRANFTCVIGFAATSDPTVIRVYRDGKLVSGSVQKIFGGQGQFNYQWTDEEATAGDHTYVIEVENYLITSPIKLKVKTAGSPQTSLANQKSQGVLPNLLGKTRGEVEGIMASSGWAVEYAPVWYIRYCYPELRPSPDYNLHVSFRPYQEIMSHAGDCVRAVGLLCNEDWYNKLNPFHRCRSAKELIPAEILNRKPDGVYLSSPSRNAITVIWYINGQTFMTELSDTKPLFKQEKTRGKRGARYYLNQNGQDFRNCRFVLSFLCVDEIVKSISHKFEGGYIGHYTDMIGFAYHIWYHPFGQFLPFWYPLFGNSRRAVFLLC